jgi:hypothetical protein
MKKIFLMLSLAAMFAAGSWQSAQAQRHNKTYYFTYAMGNNLYVDESGSETQFIKYDELLAIVSPVTEFAIEWDGVYTIHEMGSVETSVNIDFRQFLNAYVSDRLKVGISGNSFYVYSSPNRDEVVKRRNERIAELRDWNLFLIPQNYYHYHYSGDPFYYSCGTPYTNALWTKNHCPKIEKDESSSNKSSGKEKESDRPVYVAVNRFTGERVVCSTLREQQEWEAKFAKDNQVADRIETQNTVYRNAASNAIRNGADRDASLKMSADLQRATMATYGTTRLYQKAGEQLGNVTTYISVFCYYISISSNEKARGWLETNDEKFEDFGKWIKEK